jgi:hypothetical protein
VNQQESVFFDNRQESVYEPRQSNTAANQQREQDGPCRFLTPERSMLQGEKLFPKSRSFQGSNDSWRWKVVLAIICFLLIAIGLIISAIPQQLTAPGVMPMPIRSGPAPYRHTFNTTGVSGQIQARTQEGDITLDGVALTRQTYHPRRASDTRGEPGSRVLPPHPGSS